MPVFFYIDPEFSEDPALAKVDTIILSYTFFEAKEGEDYIIPSPHTNRQQQSSTVQQTTLPLTISV